MVAFNFIMDKMINFKNNTFSPGYKDDGIYSIYKVFFSILYNNYGNKYKSKLHFLQDTLNNFYFSINTDDKFDFLNLFCKIQKVYHIINRFFYLYKYKKSKLVVDIDLQLNNIKIGDINVISIYHFNNIYLFKIQELLKLIYISLTNSYMYFSEPISIKNPYNNIPFGKSILYYICYVLEEKINIKYIEYKYLDIFLKFKQSDFNMSKFVNNYEYILRDYAIQNHINNSTKETLEYEILDIIKDFNKSYKNDEDKIHISDDFPQDVLIKIFKPYLELKLISDYSLVNKNKIYAKRKLKMKLIEFKKFNPKFGNKIFKLKSIIKKNKFKRVISNIEFNTISKKFNTEEIDNFMNNHLSYKYDQYSTDNDINNNYDENSEDEIPDLIPVANYPENNNVVGENIFNPSIFTQIMFNSQFNNNQEDEDEEEGEYIDEFEGDITSEEYDENDNESIS